MEFEYFFFFSFLYVRRKLKKKKRKKEAKPRGVGGRERERELNLKWKPAEKEKLIKWNRKTVSGKWNRKTAELREEISPLPTQFVVKIFFLRIHFWNPIKTGKAQQNKPWEKREEMRVKWSVVCVCVLRIEGELYWFEWRVKSGGKWKWREWGES